jgi:hypothetical protein
MSFQKNVEYTLVEQACDTVPGFRQAYSKFVEHAAIHQKSKSLVINYSRNIAQLALHFTTVPHQVSSDEINAYLYRISVQVNFDADACPCCLSGRMHTIRFFAANAPPPGENVSLTRQHVAS